MERSQVATEYIVIFGTVIIIAIIVVATLGGVPGLGGTLNEGAVRAQLASLAIGVSNYALGHSSASLEIVNNQAGPVVVEQIRIGDQHCPTQVTLKVGERRSLDCGPLAPAQPEATFQREFSITWYDSRAQAQHTTKSLSLVGTVDSRFCEPGGEGDPDDPIIICNCDGLQAMQDNLSASYALGASIDCSVSRGWGGFSPVGSNTNPFSGSFDGANHSIHGLYINEPLEYHVGLFGYVSSTGSIFDVSLHDVEVIGGYQAGSLVGYLSGEVYRVSAHGVAYMGDYETGGLIGTISGGLLYDAYSRVTVQRTSALWGPSGSLVGYIPSGSINRAYATGALLGSIDYVGGLVGYSDGAIHDVYSTSYIEQQGDVYTGGLIGYLDAAFSGGYWYNVSDDAAVICVGSGESCAGEAPSESYFFDASNPPLNSWDFRNVWIESVDDHPRLRGADCSCS